MKKSLSKKLNLHRESLRRLEAALSGTDVTQVATGACCHTRAPQPGCNPDVTLVPGGCG